MDCCAAPNGLDTVFDERHARRDSQNYLKKGLDQPARQMAQLLKEQGVAGASVLEIGAGAGGLHLDLLRAGAARAVDLDVVPAYLEAARRTAAALGLADRVEHRLHDIAEQPAAVEAADVVVMNRVVCCYPHMERLVRPAAERARQLFALTFPRDLWWIRLFGRLMNGWQRLTRSDFRLYLHPPAAIAAVAVASGLAPIHQSVRGFWQIAVFRRA